MVYRRLLFVLVLVCSAPVVAEPLNWIDRLNAAVRENAALREPTGQGASAAPSTGVVLESRQIGMSKHGRPLMLIHVTASGASAKQSIFVVAGQHGNEPAGPQGMLNLIQSLARGAEPVVEAALESTDLYIVPVSNPDALSAGTRRMPGGTNMNRDWYKLRAVETQAIWDSINLVQPALVFDLHEERPHDRPGSYVAVSAPMDSSRYAKTVQAAARELGWRLPVEYPRSPVGVGLLYTEFSGSHGRPGILVETKYHSRKTNDLEYRASIHSAAVLSVLTDITGTSQAQKDFFRAASGIDANAVSEMLAANPWLIRAVARDGSGPLHYAAQCGSASVIAALASKGADANARLKNGVTPLQIAASFGRPEAVSALLSAGADPDAKDCKGRTALSIARGKGCESVVRLLTEAPGRSAKAE